jgi:hypothetical protein
MRRRACEALGQLLVVGAVLAVLRLTERGAIASPPLTAPGRWSEWMTTREPHAAVVGVLRLMGLSACWYLLALSVASGVAQLTSRRALLRTADRLTPPPLRPVVRAIVGAGLVAASALRIPPALAAATPPPTIVMTRLSGSPPSSAVPPPPPTSLPAPPAPPAATWVVRPGDSFWSIAHDVVQRQTGHSPSPHEITSYWRALVDTNRSRLADPANADLIFPTQEFRLPPLAAD